MVRVVVLVLTISLTLVLLPIAINVGTGGTAPEFLEPYVGWTWPVIGVLWLVAIGTGLAQYRSRRTVGQSARSADQPRNRPNALARVDRYLADRFAGSLASQTRLALALDVSPEAVIRPYDLLVQPLNSNVTEVREDADIGAAFDDLQDSMLILGAPGAGKTTLLLELARTLAAQARSNPNSPIPVLVDLSSWTASTARAEEDAPGDSPLLAGFIRWLLTELTNRYQIPAAVGRVWLSKGRLGLLLDGLDEVALAHQEKLAPVLAELGQRYLVGQIAVTCRIQEYEALQHRLKLYGAVRIRPLSRQQVLDYFASGGAELAGALAAMERDGDLWDLVNSPLMLNVMALAYQGRDARDIAGGVLADHRRELFDTFISEVLARYRPSSPQFESRAAVRSLWCLAWWTRTRAGDRIEVPRRLTPNGWYGLILPAVGYLAHMVCLPGLFAGLAAGAAVGATALYGVSAGLAVAATALALVHVRPHTWWTLQQGSDQPRWQLLAVMVCLGAVAGLASVLIVTTIAESLPSWIGLAFEGAVVWVSYGLEYILSGNNRRRLLLSVRLLGVTVASWFVFATVDHPQDFVAGGAIGLVVAQGIRFVKALPMDHLVYPHSKEENADDRWRMGKWTGAGALAGTLVAAALGASLWWSNGPEAILGIIAGTVASKAWRRRAPFLAGGLSRGLHGFLLRWSGYLPWRRGAFLRYAAERYVVSKTGRGEYAFIHLLVRDHLAECDPDALAAKVDQRIAARTNRNNLTRSR
ncbi:NACHT domain-containing protein [Streptomyces sp. SID13031]|uniref:NACHT domain-containing protein n=1 Tax=Streptomyces sp. SID13031 TaxID=2706046 RepID=UPI0013CA0BC9|nr:NACHT domain-containing protein [Streptomyces sp. SID13031]NEA33234.1 NACHT domain-containing protein [Streptomyces sp. SID13031]